MAPQTGSGAGGQSTAELMNEVAEGVLDKVSYSIPSAEPGSFHSNYSVEVYRN